MAPIRCCFDQTAVWHSDAARGPSTPSFDHLVGSTEQRRWNFQAECFCRVEVDHELEFRRLQHRQVCRSGTLENPPSIDAKLTIRVSSFVTVTDESARVGEIASLVDRGHSITHRQCHEQTAAATEKWIRCDDKRAITLLHQFPECAGEFSFDTCRQDVQLTPNHARSFLHVLHLELTVGIFRVYQ